MRAADYLALALLVLLAACGGEAFTIGAAGDDAGDVDAAADAGADDAGDVDAASSVDAGDVDGGDGLADVGAPDHATGDAGLCCKWLDAGAHFTTCGAGTWGCYATLADARAVENCAPVVTCDAGAACVLNDNTHGTVYGVVEACP